MPPLISKPVPILEAAQVAGLNFIFAESIKRDDVLSAPIAEISVTTVTLINENLS